MAQIQSLQWLSFDSRGPTVALVRSNGQVFKCIMRRPTNGNVATRLQRNSTPPQSGLEAGLYEYDAQSQCCTQYTYNIIAPQFCCHFNSKVTL